MLELLAPAKDKKCAKAAIDYGADAIYIGASEFGARKNVPNSIKDIQEIVEYAHKFNVKVYITINTILTDEEILRAEKLIKNLEEIGVDAIIIQDFGLIEKLKSFNCSPIQPFNENLVSLNFHASTQCDNRTVEKVDFLKNVGFSRVILARELSIEQIKEIKQKTQAELEAFIHGALCVSYSGQCYLSHMIGGRSANRGECAQPCRKKYSLMCENSDEDGNFIAKNKYLLCLKDFNASKHIKALVEAGVTSFKIEGRLKDVNYVKNVVAYYRKLIDELGYKKTSSGQILFDFDPDVNKSFNRGFTDYFLDGKRKDFHNFNTPKSIGEYIGEIKSIGKNYCEINSPFPIPCSLSPQDGLCFFTKDEELQGFLVNKVEGSKIYPNKMNNLFVGADIYRNFDSEFEKKLNQSKTCRKIEVNIAFELNKITAIDEDKNTVEISYEFDEFAKNKEKMGVNVINQFKKAGDTIFIVKNVNIATEKLPFLSISQLNGLRRHILEKLTSERLKNYKVAKNKGRFPKCYPQREIDYKGNVLNKYAKEFYEDQGCKVIELALEKNKNKSDYKGKCAMTTKHCLKHAFNLCQSDKKLYLVDEKGKKYSLKFNCDKCEMEICF